MASRASNGQFSKRADASERQTNRREEDAIQRTFVQYFKMWGGACEGFSIPNEAAGGGAQAAKRTRALMAMGLRPGAPDYCVFWPHYGFTKLHFIEFKSPTGSIQPTQREFAECAASAHAGHSFCRSWEEAWRALQDAGAPLERYLADGNMTRFIINPGLADHPSAPIDVELVGQIT